MERVAALGRRVLPRGWRDFAIQLGIWFGFYFTYLGRPTDVARHPARRSANGVARDLARATVHAPSLRADGGARRRLVPLPPDRRGLDVLELGVHRDRPGAALGLPAPARGFTRFRNTILLANLIGLVGFVSDADRTAVDVPGTWGSSTASTTRARFSRRSATSTRRCRASMRRTPSSSAASSFQLADALGEGALGALAPLGLVLRRSRRRTTTSSTCSPGSGGRHRAARDGVDAAGPRAHPRLGPVIANLL